MTDKQFLELREVIEKISYGEILLKIEAKEVVLVEIKKKVKLSK